MIEILSTIVAVASFQTTDGARVYDSSGVTVIALPQVADISRWSVNLTPTVSIGAELGEPEYEFYALAGAVRLASGALVVGDRGSHSLRYFDTRGKIQLLTGGAGEGPGEFRDVSEIVRLRGDTVLVVDWALRRLSFFSEAGKFVSSVLLPVNRAVPGPSVRGELATGEFVVIPMGLLLRADGPARMLRDSIPVLLFGRDDAWQDMLPAAAGFDVEVRGDGGGRYGKRSVTFGRGPLVSVWDSLVGIGDTGRWELLWFTRNGVLRRVIRRESRPRRVLPSDHAAYIAEWRARLPEGARDRVTDQMRNARFAETFPVLHDRVLVDQIDRLWVGDYVAPRDTTQLWTVIDHSGRTGCVELPAGYRLWDAGSDYVVVEIPGELETPTVAVLSFGA